MNDEGQWRRVGGDDPWIAIDVDPASIPAGPAIKPDPDAAEAS